MNSVETLYQNLNKRIKVKSEKVLVPISGGFDSRVIAGFLKDRIDLGFVFYTDKRYKHIAYAQRIADECGVKNFHLIYVTEKDMNWSKPILESMGLHNQEIFSALKKLNDIVDLSDYSLYIAHGLDFLTGREVNLFNLLNPMWNFKKYNDWYINVYHKLEEIWIDLVGTYFTKEALSLIWDDNFINYCLGLSLKNRHHQYLYRQMIKNYFPELANIEREDLDVKTNKGEINYFVARLRYFIKKILNGKMMAVTKKYIDGKCSTKN